MRLFGGSSGQAHFYFGSYLYYTIRMRYKVLDNSDLHPELERQARVLFGQLTISREPMPLEDIIKSGSTTLLCCLNKDRLLGMACLARYKVVSGKKGWIEDVVVDASVRGKGIGRELMTRLLVLGKEQGLSEILLFTGSTRLPAIALYESLGFKQKDSGLYIIKI